MRNRKNPARSGRGNRLQDAHTGNASDSADAEDYPHSHGSAEYDRDDEVLRGITSEYRSRIQAEYEREQQNVTPKTKHAQIIYSTA